MTDEHRQRAFELVAGTPWAILPEALEQIVAIASRMNERPEAFAVRPGRPLDKTRTVTVRDGTAILPIVGPIFHRANLFSDISGATSVELLARDFHQVVESAEVHRIVLEVDSPGGQIDGISELADMIFSARQRKPMTAYVSAVGASGAYWLASSANEIVLADTASVGSIGVAAVFRPRSGDAIEIVSSQSPRKRADPRTDAGRVQLQTHVDQLAEIFIGKVGRNRGVDRDIVVKDFGAGGVLIGARAVEAGLGDRVGSLEGVLAGLRSGLVPTSAQHETGGRTMDEIETEAFKQARRAEWDSNPKLRGEFVDFDGYHQFKLAEATGRIRAIAGRGFPKDAA